MMKRMNKLGQKRPDAPRHRRAAAAAADSDDRPALQDKGDEHGTQDSHGPRRRQEAAVLQHRGRGYRAARATAASSRSSAPTIRCSTRSHPERLVLKTERIQHWLGVGALPTERVARFLGDAGLARQARDPRDAEEIGATQDAGARGGAAAAPRRRRQQRAGGVARRLMRRGIRDLPLRRSERPRLIPPEREGGWRVAAC